MLGQDEISAPRFQNVEEDFDYYDSIVVYHDLAELTQQTPGWFNSLPAVAGPGNLNFFDVRNKANTDLAYCNVETRDMTAFAMRIQKMAVQFWAPSNKFLRWLSENAGAQAFYDAYAATFWCTDLPRHCSVTLRVQQDERLKTTSMMVPSGYGPTLGASGQLGLHGQGVHSVGVNHFVSSNGQAHLQNQWPFPEAIEVPRRAQLSVQLNINEYGRQALAALPALGGHYLMAVDDLIHMPFGITVSISGKRYVQQRGELHA